MNIRRYAALVAAIIPVACTSTSEGLEVARDAADERVLADFDATTLTVSLADGRQFRGPYTVDAGRGKVLATMSGVTGGELHCRLRLARHASSLEDGARGRCELREGITFDVDVAPRSNEGIAVRR